MDRSHPSRGYRRSRYASKTEREREREREPIDTITSKKRIEIVTRLLFSNGFPCRNLRQPNHAPGDSFWLLKAMLQPQAAIVVDLLRKGSSLAMDATPRRQW